MNKKDLEAQLFVNIANAIDEKGWVQLAPYGDFFNIDAKGNRVIQRFQKQDAENIVNEFNSNATLPQRLLGLPWYIGHPDHPRFKDIHTDTKSYGRIKKLEVRDDGLYANVKFGSAGKALLDDEAFHGHSVNWLALPNGSENGMQIFRPVLLKSVGFTNAPQIPARPASLANDSVLATASFDQPMPGYAVGWVDPNEKARNQAIDEMTIPPKLKVIAGFKADDEVTIDQVVSALEKKQTTAIQNEKPVELSIGDKKFSIIPANEESKKLPEDLLQIATNLANEKKARKEERKGRATLVVDPLVKAGKIVSADRDAKIEELCNADDFDAKAKEFANAKTVVKTAAKSTELAGRHAVMNGDDAPRKFESLLSARAEKFPNEAYQDRFAAVANSDEGAQLIAGMKRAGSED